MDDQKNTQIPATAPTPSPTPATSPSVSAPTGPRKRILVVEDERYLRELYVEILKEEGYEVDWAADGEEGYQAMYNGGYDLVLLDIILPKMDGLKILKKLKHETPPQKPNGVIIVLSNLG